MRKNILFFILVLTLSIVTAPYFGNWYDKFSPQYGSAFWGPDKTDAISIVGFFVAYAFLIPLIFALFGYGNRKKLIFWSLLPIALLWLFVDINYIYIPVILALIGFCVAWVLRKVFVRKPQIQ